MKSLMYVLLVAGAVASAAEEPQQGTAATPSITSQLEVPALPEGMRGLYQDGKPRLVDDLKLRVAAPAAPVVHFMRKASGSCYFIRTVRPVPADANASRSGFILLQARTTGFVRDPVCTGDAGLMRAIPVATEIIANAGSDSQQQGR